MSTPTITVRIRKFRARLCPCHDIYQVQLDTATGTWDHTAGSEHDLNSFLQGVKAGASLGGVFLTLPELPSDYAGDLQ